MKDFKLNVIYEKINVFLKDSRNGKISQNKREKMFYFVLNLDKRTETQKTRFLLYYNLFPRKARKKLTFEDIGNIYKCSGRAVRGSVVEVKNTFSRMSKEKQEELLKIIEGRE